MTRLMIRLLGTAALAGGLLLLTAPPGAHAQDDRQMSPQLALRLLTQLEGTWEGLMLGDTKVSVSYESVSRGTAVLEVVGRGTDKEMATVYAFEDNELVADHYCLGGYRTRMVLNREASTTDRLVFDFVNLNNVSLQTAPETVYVQGLVIQIPGEGPEARARGFDYGQVHAQGLKNLGLYETRLTPADEATRRGKSKKK